MESTVRVSGRVEHCDRQRSLVFPLYLSASVVSFLPTFDLSSCLLSISPLTVQPIHSFAATTFVLPSLESLSPKVTLRSAQRLSPFPLSFVHPFVIPLDSSQQQSFTLNRQTCISNNHQTAGPVIHLNCSCCAQASTKTANPLLYQIPFHSSHLSKAIFHNQPTQTTYNMDSPEPDKRR